MPPRRDLLFVTSDAVTYHDVAIWLLTGEDTDSLSTRPLLYPFLLMVILKLGGNAALFYVQILFWVLAVNFCYASLWSLCKNKLVSFLGAAILACNLSLMALVAHALTEVITVFLLSVMIFLVVKHRAEYKHFSFGLRLLGLFVLLTLVKPVFYLPAACLLVSALFFYRKQLFYKPMKLMLFALILLPMIGQMTLVYSKFDSFKVSTIGSRTLTRYFFAQGIARLENLDRQTAIVKAESCSKTERLKYLSANSSVYLSLFLGNVKGNIKGAPIYLKYPNTLNGQISERFMKHYNHISFQLHWIMLFLGLVILVVLWRKKNVELFIPVLVCFLLNIYLLLVSGISFFQGDRLTISNIAIWSVLYPSLIYLMYNIIKKSSSGSKL